MAKYQDQDIPSQEKILYFILESKNFDWQQQIYLCMPP